MSDTAIFMARFYNASMAVSNGLLLDVSLWSANLLNLETEIAAVAPYADSFHLDVADGHFVPTLLFFPDLVAAIRKATSKPLHVHLMVNNPALLVQPFIDAGADMISVQVETKTAGETLRQIAAAGRKAGVAVLLETPIEAVRQFLPHVDTVIAMGTQVGIKGVDLSPEACPRIAALRKLVNLHPNVKICADGGIRQHTVPELRRAGADTVVPGSLLFNSPDRKSTYAWLKSL